MPIYEWACGTDLCVANGYRTEVLSKTFTPTVPFCPECGQQMSMCVSHVSAVWLKPLGRYNGGQQDGHTVLRKNSCRLAGRTLETEYITTVQQQREYCRQEGLVMPDEMPSSLSVDDEGRKLQDGMPGTWAGNPASMVPAAEGYEDKRPIKAGTW